MGVLGIPDSLLILSGIGDRRSGVASGFSRTWYVVSGFSRTWYVVSGFSRTLPATRRDVSEPNQEHLPPRAVLGNFQQFPDRRKARLAGQVVGHIRARHRRNRVHDNVTVVHAVAAADLHVRARPDADAAPDPPASDPVAKAPGKRHDATLPRFAPAPATGNQADRSTRWLPSMSTLRGAHTCHFRIGRRGAEAR